MLTPWERQRVILALEASDLIQVGGQTMILMPVDDGILETLAVWGAESADDEDNHDREEACEDEGTEVDDEDAPGFLDVPEAMRRKVPPPRKLNVRVL